MPPRSSCNEPAASGPTQILIPESSTVTAGGATSWYGFAEAILDEAIGQGLLPNRPKVRPIVTSDYPMSAARPKNSHLAGERLRKRFGIALAEWQQGLALACRIRR
jgi:dTDP-4-dehydrorhamnose reductase